MVRVLEVGCITNLAINMLFEVVFLAKTAMLGL